MLLKELTIICLISILNGQVEDECCPFKVVGEIDYTHVGEISDPQFYGCSNGCVYKSVDGNPNSQYCFKPGPLNSECVSRIPSLGDFAFLITGGQSAEKKVEVYSSTGNKICNLQDLPEDRFGHTLNQNIACGGVDPQVRQSCVFYESGTWNDFTWELNNPRKRHVSWKRPNGDIYLMGGGNNEYTTEIISTSASQSIEGFNLEHPVMEACAIQFDDYVIITGGTNSLGIVSKYTDNGFVEDLPNLLSGRYGHGCGHYTNENDELVLLVTGGTTGTVQQGTGTFFSSTEILVVGETEWKFTGDLPTKRRHLRGVSFQNRIFMTGGRHFEENATEPTPINEVVEFNTKEGKWVVNGALNFVRNYHAIDVIPLEDVFPYCKENPIKMYGS